MKNLWIVLLPLYCMVGTPAFSQLYINQGGTITILKGTTVVVNSSSINQGTVDNYGKLLLSIVPMANEIGLQNSGVFLNNACAELEMFAPLDNSATFTNTGLFQVNTTDAHINSALTNNGIISYPVGNPIPNVTNNEIIIAPTIANNCDCINPSFGLGSPVDFTIGIFTDEDAMTSAGMYDTGTNTFTPTSELAEGTYNYYVKIEDAVGGCARIIPWQLTTENCLPCGWSQDADGVNCIDGNSVSFNPATSVFSVTSKNCYYANPFSSDATAFAQQTLCGNGSITAQVTSISGGLGWAGVVMRDDNSAGAKKAQLMTNLSNFSRREFRTITGGSAYPQQFPSQNRYWLRITRTGNQFVMHISPNGGSWFFAGAQNISMGSCLVAGLVVTNYNANSTVTATFANVSVSGSTPARPAWSDNGDIAEAVPGIADFSITPNPTAGLIQLDMQAYSDRTLQLEVINLQGQILKAQMIHSVGEREEIDLSSYANGMYLIRVRAEGLPDMTKRVVLNSGY